MRANVLLFLISSINNFIPARSKRDADMED